MELSPAAMKTKAIMVTGQLIFTAITLGILAPS